MINKENNWASLCYFYYLIKDISGPRHGIYIGFFWYTSFKTVLCLLGDKFCRSRSIINLYKLIDSRTLTGVGMGGTSKNKGLTKSVMYGRS